MADSKTTGKIAVRNDTPAGALALLVADYRGTFARLLPAHLDAEAFVGVAAGAMYRDPNLAAAAASDPGSLIVALRDCARLGHTPGTDQYALTVRKNKGVPSILGIEQYQGVIERMYRAGAVKAVHAEVVCKGETLWLVAGGRPNHGVEDWFARDTTVGNLVGAYAFAELEGHVISRVVAMGRDEIMRHRAAAATTNVWDGPFGKSMWLKTVAHELEKWVPTSPEYAREKARVTAVLAKEAPTQPAARGGEAYQPDPPSVPQGPPPAPALDAVVVDDDPWPPAKTPPK